MELTLHINRTSYTTCKSLRVSLQTLAPVKMADLLQPDPNSLQIPCKKQRSPPLQTTLTRFQAQSSCYKALSISTLAYKELQVKCL